MRVAIAGAGNVGVFIANELANTGHEVMVLEQSPDVVQRVQPHAADAVEWIVADACEVASLRSAGLETCDVIVAATGDDEDNLVISLLSKQEFGVPRVVARVNHPKNEWLFNEAWGVDVAVSTPRLLSALVEEAVTVGDLVRLLSFRRGEANLVEVTLPPDAPIAGHRVGSIQWPRDVALVAILRDNRVITPSPDDPLEAGDELMFLSAPDMEDTLHDLIARGGD
jgi:trk system potassium uptake protein TrkA